MQAGGGPDGMIDCKTWQSLDGMCFVRRAAVCLRHCQYPETFEPSFVQLGISSSVTRKAIWIA